MLEILYPHADFFVINVSSPNSPRGFRLSEARYLAELLRAAQEARNQCGGKAGQGLKPLFVKIPPVLEAARLREICEVFQSVRIDGVIATNSVPTPYGGLSGLPLRELALGTLARLRLHLGGAIPIIGVGGILSGQDAWTRICAGASFLEIFTGFVLRGPGLLEEISRTLEEKLKERGWTRIEQACGTEAHAYAR
jgi:dihydroorotate dehydrogenase